MNGFNFDFDFNFELRIVVLPGAHDHRVSAMTVHMSRVVVVTGALFASSVAAAHTQQDERSVVVDLRIGDLDRPDYALTRVSDIAVDEQGTMFVGQPQEALIRVYDRNGRFQRNFGREGAGPGEFRSVDTLRTTQRGLLVLDKSQRRLSLLTPAGQPTMSWGAPAHQYGNGLVGTAPQAVLADGSLIVVRSVAASFEFLPVESPVV